MSDSKWSSKNKLTTIGSGTTFCCLNEEDVNSNVIVPVTGITNLTLPSVTGMTVGNLINVTPTTVNFNGGASMSINNTTMSVANNNLIRMYPNNINLNGGLLRVEHDSYEFDHFYAGIDYGSGKGLIKIDAYDGDPNYSRVELGINGKAIGVTGETNFKVGDGKLIDLKYDPTDYYNRSLNIGSGELLRLYKSQDGARNCNIGGTEGNILKAYVGTGGTNCFLSDNLISAESGTNNNFKVKVNDGSGELYLIDLVYDGGSNSNGVCGDYEYTNTFVSSIQKLGYLLELSDSQGGQICKLGENGLLLNINSGANAVNINTNETMVGNTINIGNTDATSIYVGGGGLISVTNDRQTTGETESVSVGDSLLSIARLNGANNYFQVGGGTGSGNHKFIFMNTATNATNINTNEPTAANTITIGNSSVTTLRCGTDVITAISDIRDKKDITPITKGIDFINELTPVEFTWNMRDGGRVGDKAMGFIAQELLEAQEKTQITVPGLVRELGVDKLGAAYSTLLPLMVKSIQDLSKEIENLKQQINDLKK